MLVCMRTTLSLDDELLQEVRRMAVESRRTMSEVVADAIRVAIHANRNVSKHPPVVLKTFKTDGYQPGIDPNRGASIYEAMDESDGRFR